MGLDHDGEGRGRLLGRTALVTGGSRGVGRAIAVRLAREGAVVAVNYRVDATAAAEVVAEICAAGGRAAAFAGSVADVDEVPKMVGQIEAEFGVVDLLVSNAGTASRGDHLAKTPPSEFVKLMEVHTFGPIRLIQRLLPGMRSAERADVVVISTAVTDYCPPGGAPYTMAKSAMESAMRTLSREERVHNIRVNVVAPGLVATDMGARLVAAASKDIAGLERDSPFGRVCRPDDVAGVVAFLASADGAYLTGTRTVVDGGGPDPTIF